MCVLSQFLVSKNLKKSKKVHSRFHKLTFPELSGYTVRNFRRFDEQFCRSDKKFQSFTTYLSNRHTYIRRNYPSFFVLWIVQCLRNLFVPHTVNNYRIERCKHSTCVETVRKNCQPLSRSLFDQVDDRPSPDTSVRFINDSMRG